jgi:hypothetical protein
MRRAGRVASDAIAVAIVCGYVIVCGRVGRRVASMIDFAQGVNDIAQAVKPRRHAGA